MPSTTKIVSPCLLLLTEKHGSRYFLVSDTHHLNRTAHEIVRQRTEEGWYDRARVFTILHNSASLQLAYDFLVDRSDYEYEGVELIHLEVVP